MELKIHAGSADPAFLVGKYSESFVSELARQITLAIEDAMGITGLDGSTLRLELVFAPGTYMEHTSDNVTYRRLLLSDKSCQARDFWVKWTRLDGAVAYTVSDDVTEDSIKFELGEDVPQKIREREFRFLCAKNPDKYQSAMGKKTVTEWRDLIRRAIKRNDVVKLESELSELAKDEQSVEDKLLEVLSSFGKTVELEDEAEKAEVSSFDNIMELARAALDRESAPAPEIEEPDLPWLELDEETAKEAVEEELAEEDGTEAVPETEAVAEIEDEPELYEETEPEEEIEEEIEAEPEEEPETVAVTEPEAHRMPSEEEIRREIEARVRRELEEKLRLEYEAKLRLEYEEREREKLREAERREREENEKLRRDNEKLAELARLAEAERAREEAERLKLIERKRREEEELRFRLEKEAEERARERDRLEEAARRAVIEERERELQEKKQREEAEARAEAAPMVKEPEPELVGYLAKHARLMFRRPVDLNIIQRIREIIEKTLISERKENLPLRMKAYPVDDTTIGLDILRIPESEKQLLVTMMKALGNAGLGISRITLE